LIEIIGTLFVRRNATAIEIRPNSLKRHAFPALARAVNIRGRATKYSQAAGVRHRRDVQSHEKKIFF
jgi:hypothetical protein